MMRLPKAHPLLTALLLSFLIHVIVLFGTTIELPDWAPAPQLTVELQAPPPKPAAPLAEPAPKPRPQPRPKPLQPAPAPAAPVAATAEPTPAPEPVAAAPEPVAPEPAPPPPPNAAVQRAFPSQIEVVYAVHRGDQGLLLGRTTHKWRIANNQYLLTSTTEAIGFISLFFRGRYIMTSKGELTADGLQPVSFWIQRGQSENRTESAEFDWAAKTLDFGKGTERNIVNIQAGAQDQLSVLYQLALTAPHRERQDIALTTGRKFNHYSYQVAGEEMLETAFGKLRVERLTRIVTKEKSDSADIWLAIEHHYLPVRFRLGTRDGEVLDHWMVDLRLEGKRVETKVEE